MSDFEHKDLYYDLTKILSYDKYLYFVLGARNRGKSYAAKRWAINGWLKKKKQFIYVRRYDTELREIKTYFDDISDLYPDHTFKVESRCFYIDDELAGWYFPLSTANRLKSSSFPNVDKIIFDEFIIENGRTTYVKGEVEIFLNLIQTVGRARNDLRVLLLSNSVSAINPYFLYFNIYPHENDKFIIKDEIIVHIDQNEAFVDFMNTTKFGRLVKGSKYGDYAINNKFLADNDSFIEKMTGKCYCWYVLKYMDVKYSVWYGQDTGYVYITKKDAPENIPMYAVTTDDHMPNMILLDTRKDMFKNLVKYYNYSQVRFDTLQSKSAFYEIIRLI